MRYIEYDASPTLAKTFFPEKEFFEQLKIKQLKKRAIGTPKLPGIL
jgi:hypothetical protein